MIAYVQKILRLRIADKPIVPLKPIGKTQTKKKP